MSGRKIKYVKYVTAWLAYIGAFITKCSNIGNIVADSFNDIKIPKKTDFEY